MAFTSSHGWHWLTSCCWFPRCIFSAPNFLKAEKDAVEGDEGPSLSLPLGFPLSLGQSVSHSPGCCFPGSCWMGNKQAPITASIQSWLAVSGTSG